MFIHNNFLFLCLFFYYLQKFEPYDSCYALKQVNGEFKKEEEEEYIDLSGSAKRKMSVYGYREIILFYYKKIVQKITNINPKPHMG